MSRERTRKIRRLAVLKMFQEQRSRQAFVATRRDAMRLAGAEEACDAVLRQHGFHVERLLASPALDIGRYVLLRERVDVASRLVDTAREKRKTADRASERAGEAWALSRLAAVVTADRVDTMSREDARDIETRQMNDLVDLRFGRRQS